MTDPKVLAHPILAVSTEVRRGYWAALHVHPHRQPVRRACTALATQDSRPSEDIIMDLALLVPRCVGLLSDVQARAVATSVCFVVDVLCHSSGCPQRVSWLATSNHTTCTQKDNGNHVIGRVLNGSWAHVLCQTIRHQLPRHTITLLHACSYGSVSRYLQCVACQ